MNKNKWDTYYWISKKDFDKIIKERFQRQERYSLDNNFV